MSPMIRNITRSLAVAALAVSLSGCITLLPKTKPVGLYRFGEAQVSVAKGPPGTMFGVLKTPSAFTRAAAGDRILTSTSGEVAYIAGARWVSPAFVLFEEARSAEPPKRVGTFLASALIAAPEA